MNLIIIFLHCISFWITPPLCGAFYNLSINRIRSQSRILESTAPQLSSWGSFTSVLSSSQSSANLLSMSASQNTSSQQVKPVQGRKRSVYLKHERDFFRQAARLESMDSYVLVSTLTASMSFGALLGFKSAAATTALTTGRTVRALGYRILCSTVPVVAGFSAIFGLYATIMFSLTILYGKSALGAERDLEYERFLKRTARSRVHGARCFTLSLGLFAFEAFLVLLERTYFRPWFLAVLGSTVVVLVSLYRDWRLIFRTAEYVHRD